MTKSTHENTKHRPDLRYTKPAVRKVSPIVKIGAILLCLLGGFFLLGGMVLLVTRLAGRGPENIDRFTIVFDLVVGSAFLSSGILLPGPVLLQKPLNALTHSALPAVETLWLRSISLA